ncbi:MAG TPA: PEP-CTERM sorting domain-containing protein [Actinomycetota bacterium]
MTAIPRARGRAALLALSMLVIAAAALPGQASLESVEEDGGAAFIGRGWYSADGLGQFTGGGTVQADVPAGSTVEAAYLYASYYFTSSPIPESQRTIDFDGTTVVLEQLMHAAPGPCCSLRSARADVTDQVAAKVGSGGGITDFVIGNDPPNTDGVALVVVYASPSMPFATIAVMDGGAEQTGDTTTFDFATPISKSIPDFRAEMSLGIGFGFQGGGPDVCGTAQFSTVDVNGSRLTSCAGGYNDGYGGNGGLITVGGVGDDTANPPDPNGPGGTDDELYDLAPFIADGATQIEIVTSNPSGDDIVFLAVIGVTGIAQIGCTEDGLDALHDTPADGVASGVIHDTVEPAVEGLVPGGGMIVHTINCAAVVPIEETVDAALPLAPPQDLTPGLG